MSTFLVSGGAGFIGTNVADRLARKGHTVRLYDNLSRAGVERNLRWLQQTHGSRMQFVYADIRDRAPLRDAVTGADGVFHFAAQVAVTTSLVDPLTDFSINAGGTLALLEVLREQGRQVPLFFTSTNKVYGGLEDVELDEGPTRYAPRAKVIREHGIDEDRPLDFHSPYGCSKGAADQYVIDYARSYGLSACVFRMSCIYGPHQFGNEDQGWVAHFLIRAIEGQPITLYGDGKQVRDILFVEDLVDAFEAGLANFERVRGQAFNMGGGPQNTVSLLELLEAITAMSGKRPQLSFEGWRTGDQRYYVSDLTRFSELTRWKAKTDVHRGLRRLYDWLLDSRGLFNPTTPEVVGGFS